MIMGFLLSARPALGRAVLPLTANGRALVIYMDLNPRHRTQVRMVLLLSNTGKRGCVLKCKSAHVSHIDFGLGNITDMIYDIY